MPLFSAVPNSYQNTCMASVFFLCTHAFLCTHDWVSVGWDATVFCSTEFLPLTYPMLRRIEPLHCCRKNDRICLAINLDNLTACMRTGWTLTWMDATALQMSFPLQSMDKWNQSKESGTHAWMHFMRSGITRISMANFPPALSPLSPASILRNSLQWKHCNIYQHSSPNLWILPGFTPASPDIQERPVNYRIISLQSILTCLHYQSTDGTSFLKSQAATKFRFPSCLSSSWDG